MRCFFKFSILVFRICPLCDKACGGLSLSSHPAQVVSRKWFVENAQVNLQSGHTDENQRSDDGRPAVVAGRSTCSRSLSPAVDCLHFASSTASAQHPVANQAQLKIRQLAIGGMGCQSLPNLRDDADDVLDGCHCCRPKSIAVENFSRSLDPLHFLKRLSSARHHAESPLQQTLDKKMME